MQQPMKCETAAKTGHSTSGRLDEEMGDKRARNVEQGGGDVVNSFYFKMRLCSCADGGGNGTLLQDRAQWTAKGLLNAHGLELALSKKANLTPSSASLFITQPWE